VAFTVFYLLDDAQLWFHRMELNNGRPTWPQFVQFVNARFRPPLTDSPIGELAMLWHTDAVDDYSKHFIALSCHDTTLFEPQQIQLFITGLSDPLRTDVTLQQSASLDDAVIFTRVYEQRNTSIETVSSQPAQSSSCHTFRTPALPAASTPMTLAASTASVNKPTSSSIRLSPSEISQCHKDEKCFRCDKHFTPGHRQQCKLLFIIEVVNDDVEGLSSLEGELAISIHALTGLQPHVDRTMKIVVVINGASLLALLDSDSTHNFIDTALCQGCASRSPAWAA
jgi:hypothetical protein